MLLKHKIKHKAYQVKHREHYNYIKTICGNVIISNHYRRIARLYEKINDEENQEYNIFEISQRKNDTTNLAKFLAKN